MMLEPNSQYIYVRGDIIRSRNAEKAKWHRSQTAATIGNKVNVSEILKQTSGSSIKPPKNELRDIVGEPTTAQTK
jgi:hypothetical protein